MAVQTMNGVTVLTPTPWKWWTLAAAGLFVMPLGFALMIFGGLMATGKLQRVIMTRDLLRVESMWSKREYRWNEVDDFRVKKMKSGFITAATLVAFTEQAKVGTRIGKAAKFLSGSTDSVPALGVTAQEMLALINVYKAGHVPANTQFAMPAAPRPIIQEPIIAQQPAHEQYARQSERAQPRSQPVEKLRLASKSKLQAKPKVKPNRAKQAPMVQEGFHLFGRRP